MGKVDTIILDPTMTFKEKKIKTESTELNMDKNYKPSFSPGRSVFRETGVSRLKFWRKPRNLIILLDGAMKAFELHDTATEKIEANYWTRKEKEKFINKLIAKSKAAQKVISTWQFAVIMLGLVFIVILQILILRGIRIV